jgi:hypothetical protein
MGLCVYKVRRICQVKNCCIEYGINGRCPPGLKYEEDKILNPSTSSDIEKVLKKETEKIN